MQFIGTFELGQTACPVWDVRFMLLSGEGKVGPIARQGASMGDKVDVMDEVFGALSDVIGDTADYALLVVDCGRDGVDGLDVAHPGPAELA